MLGVTKILVVGVVMIVLGLLDFGLVWLTVDYMAKAPFLFWTMYAMAACLIFFGAFLIYKTMDEVKDNPDSIF